MPESYGKRQREGAKAKKAAEREDRRLARKQRREGRAAGTEEPYSWLADPPADEPARRVPDDDAIAGSG
jgi:hypothetical protein